MAFLTTSPGLRFYREVCRCVPFLIKQFEIGELTDRHTIRRAVADRFLEHKHRENSDAIEILIMKGRQELEEVMARFKTRNHVLNTWVTDVNEKRRAAASKVPSGYTPFLDKFLVSNYDTPNAC